MAWAIPQVAMLLTALLFVASLGAADPALDAPVVPGATQLEEPGRYRSPRTFDDTLDFYQRLFNQPGVVRWRTIVNLPGIRAKHIENLRKKTKWEGINIYEYKGEVRLYVIPRDPKS
jgi:hypothetical protein